MMEESERSPLGQLVIFMICLSVAGVLVAGVYYAFVNLPGYNGLQAPTNAGAESCSAACADPYNLCVSRCDGDRTCLNLCYQVALECFRSCGIEPVG